MINAPIAVAQFYWAGEPRASQDAAMQEIFLSDAAHSLGRFWRECTFGFIGAQILGIVYPIRELPLTHDTYLDAAGDTQSHRTRGEVTTNALAVSLQLLDLPGPKVVFMFDGPSPAGAVGHDLGAFLVLDLGGSHSYMAHEIGHALGFDHSFANQVVYGDPYCLMSAMTFGGTNPTHTVPRPAGSSVPTTPGVRFWEKFGPMPAGAVLYRTLPEFRASTMVRHVGLYQSVAIRALSEATPQDTVLAVVEVDGTTWTAELRIATNWDAGLANPGVVLHGLLPPPEPDAPRVVDYQGVIALPKGDVQPGFALPNGTSPNVRLVLESYDPATHTATVSFTPRLRTPLRAVERLGPASLIQADFGADDHKNFEACILEGDELWHWWRDNSLPWKPWAKGQQIARDAAFPGTIIQSDFGSGDHGNFEVLVPLRTPSGRNRLRHFWHDNSIVTSFWQPGQWVTGDLDDVAGAAVLIQTDYETDEHRHSELVVPLRQADGTVRVRHFWHDGVDVNAPWQAGQWVTPQGQDIVGSAAFIQSDYGSGDHGNFEVIAPIRMPDGRVGLRHFWHDNSDVTSPWQPQDALPEDIFNGLYDIVGSPSLVQTDFQTDDHGNLELVVPVKASNGSVELRHFWHSDNTAGSPSWLPGQFVTQSCAGSASLMRSDYGSGDHRNFEVVVLEARGALVAYWHGNDDVNHPWLRDACFDILDEVPRVGPAAVRVAQMTGEFDREGWDGTSPARPALNRTESRFGITGTDLGVPFRHGDTTYVLYGDTWRGPFDGETDNTDAIAFTTDATADDGIQLDFHRDPPSVPGVDLGGFNVPLDGVSWQGAMYVFFSTGHYTVQGRDVMGKAVIARSDDNGRTFRYLYDLPPSRFVNVSASIVEGLDHGLSAGPQLVVLGSGRYRSSDVYLAVKPAAAIETPGGWQFYVGTSPHVSTVDGWSPDERYAGPLFPAGNVGELSVRWNPIAKCWLALWNENDGIHHRIVMRVGVRPHGPWTEPAVVFELSDGLGRFIHQPGHDNTQHIFGDAANIQGDVYGPYQFDGYARREAVNLRVFFSMSTWNPYQSMLMRTDLPLQLFVDALRSASLGFAAAGQQAEADLYARRADEVLAELSAGHAELRAEAARLVQAGIEAWTAGRHLEAYDLWRQALALLRTDGLHDAFIAYVHWPIAEYMRDDPATPQFAEAAALSAEAAGYAAQAGDVAGQAQSLADEGVALASLPARRAEAYPVWRAALALLRTAGLHTAFVAYVHWPVAEYLRGDPVSPQFAEAAALSAEAAGYAAQAGDVAGQALSLVDEGVALWAIPDRRTEAYPIWRSALALLRTAGLHDSFVRYVHWPVAEMMRDDQVTPQYAEAASLSAEAAGYASQVGDVASQAQALVDQGVALWVVLTSRAEAYPVWRSALALLRTAGLHDAFVAYVHWPVAECMRADPERPELAAEADALTAEAAQYAGGGPT